MNFNRLSDKFKELFKDSYGFDKLSKYMLIAGALFLAIDFSPLFGLFLVGYSTWRTFSKDKYKRYRELSSFENYLSIASQKLGKYKPGRHKFNLQDFGKYRFKLHDFKQYKIFKCPNCSQKLRIPRKQGKVKVTCRNCRTEFKGKS